MPENKTMQVFTDGGARGNPGPAAIGIVFLQDNSVVLEHKEFIGDTTNNQAEYTAVLRAVELAEEKGFEKLDFFLDSQLVVEQLNRRYKIKDRGLEKLFVQIWNKLPQFTSVTFTHIPREKNIEADRLVNEALDEDELAHQPYGEDDEHIV